MWCIHTTKYYSAIKCNEVPIHTTTWMNLENTLSERRQSQRTSITRFHLYWINKSLETDSCYSWPGWQTEAIILWGAVGIHLSFLIHVLGYMVCTVCEKSQSRTQGCTLSCIYAIPQLEGKIKSSSQSGVLCLLTSFLQHRTRNGVGMDLQPQNLGETNFF